MTPSVQPPQSSSSLSPMTPLPSTIPSLSPAISFVPSLTPSDSPVIVSTLVPTTVLTRASSAQDSILQVQYLFYLSNIDIYKENLSLISNAVLTFLSQTQSSLPKSVFTIVSYGQIQQKSQFPYDLYQTHSLHSTAMMATFNVIAYINPVSKYFPVSIYGNNLTMIIHSIQSVYNSINMETLSQEFNQILSHSLQISLSNNHNNVTINDLQISLLSSQPINSLNNNPSAPPTMKSNDHQNNSDANNASQSGSNNSNISVIIYAIVFSILFFIILIIFIYFIRKSFMTELDHHFFHDDHHHPEVSSTYQHNEIEEGINSSSLSNHNNRSLSSQENE
jgi:hypothetical protein